MPDDVPFDYFVDLPSKFSDFATALRVAGDVDVAIFERFYILRF
jgi:hypothetical protein